MSCPHVVWALRQRGLSAPERVVLIYLADKANGAMLCWPSIETIAERTELSDKTVRRAVQRLAELRLIRIEARRRHTHHYHILRPINGLDGDPMQPEVGDAWTVERSEIPVNSDIDRSDLPPKQVYRSDLPVNVTAQPPDNRSDLPLNAPSLPVILGAYPPKKESPKERKKERGAQGSRLPPDWTPTPGCIAFAVGRGLDPATVAEAFADYWRARAGQGACKRDWEATWRTWCRNERPPRAAPQQPRGKLDWAIASIMSEARH